MSRFIYKYIYIDKIFIHIQTYIYILYCRGLKLRMTSQFVHNGAFPATSSVLLWCTAVQSSVCRLSSGDPNHCFHCQTQRLPPGPCWISETNCTCRKESISWNVHRDLPKIRHCIGLDGHLVRSWFEVFLAWIGPNKLFWVGAWKKMYKQRGGKT